MVERRQEVEEGLCCLRVSGRSNNNKEVGGRRSCRCYREGLGVGKRGGRWLRRASAAPERVARATTTRRLTPGGAAGDIERFWKGCRSGWSGYQKSVSRRNACDNQTAGG